eukprot:TRINITY_DN103542_c0_g1_i1.p1 TRINITY_DN103542_c0_g1~~TRINITY_DN103542_c0_g1_i1.p1  ORF type:complete len:144 (+),score=7.53 TRINITY_DN103542_c0_g1_i1:18-449(+)
MDIAVKFGKETHTVHLEGTDTLNDLKNAIADVIFVPPCAQRLAGIKATDNNATLASLKAKKVMVMGTPVHEFSLHDKHFEMDPNERIERVLWNLKYLKSKGELQEEYCTQALLMLDSVDVAGDQPLREKRKQAIQTVEQMGGE